VAVTEQAFKTRENASVTDKISLNKERSKEKEKKN
jgi:hypothetical protein